MGNSSKETPIELARRLYENMPQAIQPIKINGERHWPGVEALPEWRFCERLAERLHEAENREDYSLRVNMTAGAADAASDALADVLCWAAGFEAGGGSTAPVNLEALRKLKDGLDRAIEKGRKPFRPPGAPF